MNLHRIHFIYFLFKKVKVAIGFYILSPGKSTIAPVRTLSLLFWEVQGGALEQINDGRYSDKLSPGIKSMFIYGKACSETFSCPSFHHIVFIVTLNAISLRSDQIFVKFVKVKH